MTTRPVGWSGSDRTRCRAVPMTSSGVVGRPRMSAAESDTAFGAFCDANAPLLSFAVAVGAPRTAGRPAWVPLLAPRVGRDALVTDSTSPVTCSVTASTSTSASPQSPSTSGSALNSAVATA
jgi:hypothetical protein